MARNNGVGYTCVPCGCLLLRPSLEPLKQPSFHRSLSNYRQSFFVLVSSAHFKLQIFFSLPNSLSIHTYTCIGFSWLPLLLLVIWLFRFFWSLRLHSYLRMSISGMSRMTYIWVWSLVLQTDSWITLNNKLGLQGSSPIHSAVDVFSEPF